MAGSTSERHPAVAGDSQASAPCSMARYGTARHGTVQYGTAPHAPLAHSLTHVAQAPLSPLPPAGCASRVSPAALRAGQRRRYRPGPAAQPRTSRSGDSGAAVRDRGSATAAPPCPASCGASLRFLPAGSGL